MSTLSGIWDGDLHWLEIGEAFGEGASLVVDDWEEGDEIELDPFESPDLQPVFRDTAPPRSEKYQKQFPLARVEQAWGSLSVVLSAFAKVADIEKKQYQHVWPGPGSVQGEVKWSFQATQAISERV